MTARLPKVTVWRAIFAALFVAFLYVYVHAGDVRAGRGYEPER